jgi:hypothetical protein
VVDQSAFTGVVGATQSFAVDYQSPAGRPPTLAVVDIDGVTHPLTAQGGPNGLYQYQTNQLAAGQHYHRFRVSDGTATGVYEVGHGPFLVAFTLTAGSVSPPAGPATTAFDFQVTYTHSAGLSPATALVYVDGHPSAMSLRSGSPSTGAVYSVSLTLGAGPHQYFFVFNDGLGSNALPPGPASLKGPQVS